MTTSIPVPVGGSTPVTPSPFAGAKILVVDDQPINIRLLQRKLERHGFVVLIANNGMECLQIVQHQTPDLILLDVMMPEMDGIETCRRLKAEPHSESIPIIFVTAKSSKEGKIEGLDAGAIDYITKPIDLDETMARIHTQLRFQQIYRENVVLQSRLSEARRKAAVGAITQGIAHNLNNLLGVVVGYLDLMKTALDNRALIERSVTLMDRAVGRVVNIVRQLSSLSDVDRIELHPTPLGTLIEGALDRFKSEYQGKLHNLSVDISEGFEALRINANTEIFETVIVALLNNAYESYPPDPQTTRPISIEIETPQGHNSRQECRIKVIDKGRGIDPSVEDTLFEPFVSTKTDVGCGMGLSVARHSARTLGGDLTIESMPGGGTCACFRHPL